MFKKDAAWYDNYYDEVGKNNLREERFAKMEAEEKKKQESTGESEDNILCSPLLTS